MHPKTIFLNGTNSAQCQSLNFSHLQNSCLIPSYNQLREKELEKSLSLRKNLVAICEAKSCKVFLIKPAQKRHSVIDLVFLGCVATRK